MSTTLRTDDLVIPQGTTWAVQWPLTTSGAPLDLTGYTARSQVRARISDADVLVEWTTENGSIVLANSALTLAIDPAASTAWTWRDGRYDIELVSPVGSVSRITEGRVQIAPEITR